MTVQLMTEAMISRTRTTLETNDAPSNRSSIGIWRKAPANGKLKTKLLGIVGGSVVPNPYDNEAGGRTYEARTVRERL
jgi:hypothetical protein